MKHKILWLAIVIVLGAYFFAKANPTDPTVIQVTNFLHIQWWQIMTGLTDVKEADPGDLLEEDMTVVACTLDYVPVCAEVETSCSTPPCPKVKKTFSNKCFQEANKRSTFLYEWTCK